MKKIMMFILALIFCGVVSGGEKIVIAVGEWPPFISESLRDSGFALKIVTEAFAVEGIEVEYKFLPWKRAVIESANGAFLATAIWAYREDRTNNFYYSEVVFPVNYAFFYLKSRNFEWKSVKDLENMKIGGSLGYSYGDKEFREAAKRGELKIEYAKTDVLNFKKLLIGRTDLFMCSVINGKYILDKDFRPEDRVKIRYHKKLLTSDPHHLIFSKKAKESKRYLKLFNSGLKKLRERGRYDTILKDAMK